MPGAQTAAQQPGSVLASQRWHTGSQPAERTRSRILCNQHATCLGPMLRRWIEHWSYQAQRDPGIDTWETQVHRAVPAERAPSTGCWAGLLAAHLLLRLQLGSLRSVLPGLCHSLLQLGAALVQGALGFRQPQGALLERTVLGAGCSLLQCQQHLRHTPRVLAWAAPGTARATSAGPAGARLHMWQASSQQPCC